MGILGKLCGKYKRMRNSIQYWRDEGVEIGDNCFVSPTVDFGSEPYLVKIGNHVALADRIRFMTHDGGAWVLRGLKDEYKDIDVFGRIEIGDNVLVGINVIIVPGVKIGSNCIIGSGAIVTRDIPDNSVAVGFPAKVIKTIDEYEEKNKYKFMHTKTMSPEEKKAYLLKHL